MNTERMDSNKEDLRQLGLVTRRLFISLLVALLCCNAVYSFDYEVTPLRISFNGAVGVKKNIIVYGTFGNYLFSTDLGMSWKQNFIGVFDEIRSMINYNDTLYGITYNGYFLKSVDYGVSWRIKRLEIEPEEKLLRMIATEDAIFVRGIQTLFKLNREGEITKRLKNYRFRPTRNFFVEEDYDEVGRPVNAYFNDNFYYSYRKIILNSESFCDSGFIVVEPDLSSFREISLSGKFKPWENIFYFYELVKVLSLRNSNILKIKYNLYTTDSSFLTFKYFYKDTSFMNYDTTPRVSYGFPWLYFTVGDTLFVGKSVDSVKYDTITNNSYIPSYQFHIYSVKKYLATPKDTFVVQGKPFYDVYNGSFFYLIDYVYPGLYENITVPAMTINDSIWVYVNRKRFLLITFNKGNSWKLVSYLSGIPKAILNDTTYFFVFQGRELTEVNRTTDGGITFLPSKNFVEGYDRSRAMTCFNTLPIFYIDSTGCGFLRGDYNYLENCDRIYYTYNFWDTYNFTPGYPDPDSLRSKRYIPPCEAANIVKFDNFYLIATNCKFDNLPGKPYFCNIIVLDTSYTQATRIVRNLDWHKILHILPSNNISNFIYFCLIQDTLNSWKEGFEIRSTTDTGKTHTMLHRIDNFEGEILQFYQHNADSVFFTTAFPDRLYLYDRKSNELKILWNNEESFYYPLLMVISDRFYLVGRELFLENTNRSDLTQWREGKWDYGKPNFESVIFKGNVAIAGLSDSLRPFNYYKITLKKDTATNVEDSRVDVRYYTTHFYATEPYPLPARSVVKSKLYWDGNFDLVQAIDGVYDVMGNRVEGKQRITIKELGKATAELTWNCSGVPSGIYFIVVRHNGRADTIPVIVE